jgi:hypothetical protein
VLEVEHRPWFTELGKYSTTELYLQPVVRLFYLFIFMGKYFYYLWIRFVKPHRATEHKSDCKIDFIEIKNSCWLKALNEMPNYLRG